MTARRDSDVTRHSSAAVTRGGRRARRCVSLWTGSHYWRSEPSSVPVGERGRQNADPV